MQRRDWNVSELSELLAALDRIQTAHIESTRDRALKKAGVEPQKNPLSAEFQVRMYARVSVRIAKRLKENDRTVPLRWPSQKELVEFVNEILTECERGLETSPTPDEHESMKSIVTQICEDMNALDENPAIAYDATWRRIEAVEAWATEHDKAPLAFFDQDDAYDQLLRRTQSKEEFLKEHRIAWCSADGIERVMKRMIASKLQSLLGDVNKDDPDVHMLFNEVSAEVLPEITRQMGQIYDEFVAEADRIYWKDTHALSS